MSAKKRRLICTWIAGVLVGTGIIAVSSPLFVRSYVPLRADPIRGVWTLPAGEIYRWRSEGYADTAIGPMGMPGKTSIEPAFDQLGRVPRVALWGDSQAEGVCVADDQKLFAQSEQMSAGRMQFFPLARSGEDAADWVTEMPRVEQELDIDMHVILVVDLSDLLTASQAPLPPPSESDVAAGQASIAARVPAFVIQAARHLLTEQDEVTPRTLRFSIGPVREKPPATTSVVPTDSSDRGEGWRRELQAIRDATSLPVLILYAPVSPQIINGRVIDDRVIDDQVSADGDQPSDSDYRLMSAAAKETRLDVLNARPQLIASANRGRWPHGFNNGQIGSGHLNEIGNALLGALLVERSQELIKDRLSEKREGAASKDADLRGSVDRRARKVSGEGQ